MRVDQDSGLQSKSCHVKLLSLVMCSPRGRMGVGFHNALSHDESPSIESWELPNVAGRAPDKLKMLTGSEFFDKGRMHVD